MNRIPQRPTRINPSLRGRLAASLSEKQRQQYAPAATFTRPTMIKSDRRRILTENSEEMRDSRQSDPVLLSESTQIELEVVEIAVEDTGRREAGLSLFELDRDRYQRRKELTFNQKLIGFSILFVLLLLLSNWF